MPVLLLLWLLSAAACRPAAAQEAAPRFAVLEFAIEGNTVLPVRAIERAVLPHLGPDRSLDDVERARAALEKAFQSAGYLSVVVDIPEQRVDGGVVRLRVIEGRVERLAVTGARYYDQGVIRRRVAELAPGKVPDFDRVQQQLAAASRDERRLQPVLKPGALPGTLQAEIQVEDRLPLTASVELNNQHASDTDPWRLNASLRYANLWQADHALSLTAITAPREPSQSRVWVAQYSAPLDDQWTALAYAVWSDSVVQPIGTSVIGEGFTLGLRAQRGFAFGRSAHTLALGLDFKDLKERLQFGDDSLSTPLRYLPLHLSWTGQWAEGRSQSSLNLQWTTALRSVLQRNVDCPGDVGPVDQFACKRQGGDGGFTHLRADLRHQRPAAFGWPGQWSLRLQGQLGSQALVSAEQFAVGGAETVRGYLEAEASGDRGLQGSAEWRSPDLLGSFGSSSGVQDLSVLAFLDAARVWIIDAAVGQLSRRSLFGAGLGLRVRATAGLSGEADLAWPGKRTASTPDHDPRLHLRLRAQF
jgi:hemolysin activation/secretion protein